MRSPPGARMGAGGLPGRAHPSWADSPPCTPSIWAAWVGVINSVDDGAGNAKWLSGVVNLTNEADYDSLRKAWFSPLGHSAPSSTIGKVFETRRDRQPACREKREARGEHHG